MTKFIDSLDYQSDHYIPIPHHEWRIMGAAIALVSKDLPRLCLPNCPHFLKDTDGGPLCYDECEMWIIDRHHVEKGDIILDILFSVDENDPHGGFMWWVGANYLRSLLGDKTVDRMVQEFNDLEIKPEDGVIIRQEDES